MKNCFVMVFNGVVLGYALTNIFYGLRLRKNWKELKEINKNIEVLEMEINERIKEAASTQQDIDKLLLELEKGDS